VHASWRIAAPTTASPADYQLSAEADYQAANGQVAATNTVQIAVPFASLDSAFDNPGISDDTNPAAGNLDGGGLSYSTQALAGVGLSQGAAITHDGLAFTWPSAASGAPDNVLAGGQTIAISGSGTTLGFLGAGDYGTATGTGTIIYTDGTKQPYTLAFADWFAGSAVKGGDILATAPYLNNASGKVQHTANVYYFGIPLQAGKTLKYLTLPDVSQTATKGQLAMHIFALGIG
jgi:hypothetical protein